MKVAGAGWDSCWLNRCHQGVCVFGSKPASKTIRVLTVKKFKKMQYVPVSCCLTALPPCQEREASLPLPECHAFFDAWAIRCSLSTSTLEEGDNTSDEQVLGENVVGLSHRRVLEADRLVRCAGRTSCSLQMTVRVWVTFRNSIATAPRILELVKSLDEDEICR